MSQVREHPLEAERVEAVSALAMMGTAPEERFDRIVRLAAAQFRVPIALITFLDRERQWFKARVGTDLTGTDRSSAFCAHTIVDAQDGLLVAEDATLDLRFVDNPLVRSAPHVRFYAGRVLVNGDGLPVGTLCVLDDRPRHFTDLELGALNDFAALVDEELARDEQVRRLHENERIRWSIQEGLTEGLVVHAADGSIVEWNRAAEQLLGLTGAELAGRTSTDGRWHVVREDGTSWPIETQPAAVALRTGEPSAATLGVERPDGTTVWLRVNAQPISHLSGDRQAFVLFSNLAEHSQISAATMSDDQSARLTLDALDQGVILVEPDGRVAQMNPAAERLLGYSAEEFADLGSDLWSAAYDDRWEPIERERGPIFRAYVNAEDIDGEVIGWKRRDGERVRLRLSFVHDVDGRGAVLLAFTDVTAQEVMLRDLAQYHLLFQHADDIITVLDPDLSVRYSSPATERVLGFPYGWRDSKGLLALIHPADRDAAASALAEVLSGQRRSEPVIMRVKTHDGEWRTVETVGVNLLEEPGVRGIVLTSRDITARQLLAERLAYLAGHDHLTGLANRSLLEARLTEALAQAARSGLRAGVCYLDLDGFKKVNDALGHAVGDGILLEAADRICGILRAGDAAIRVGGDEFVIVVHSLLDLDAAIEAAQRVRDSLVLPPMRRETLTVGASVGVAISAPGETTTSLLARADAALYRAKAQGGAVVCADASVPVRSREEVAPNGDAPTLAAGVVADRPGP